MVPPSHDVPWVAGDQEFPHPYLAVDVLLLTVRGAQLEIFIQRRDTEAPVGWALPGAFVDVNESIEATASRVVRGKLGFQRMPTLIPLRPFGEIDRDPRRRVVALPFAALIDPDRFGPQASGDDRTASAAVVGDGRRVVLPGGKRARLVFDHAKILREGVSELRRRVVRDDLIVYKQLLPKQFTLRQLQQVHEAVLGEAVNKDSFRRRVQASGWVVDTGEVEQDVVHRPAAYFTWSRP